MRIYFRLFLWAASILMLSLEGKAQDFALVDRWLGPLGGSVQVSIKKFDGSSLTEERVISRQNPRLPEDWNVQLQASPVPGQPAALEVAVTFELLKGVSAATAVSVAFEFDDWRRDNYVLAPAAVYNGNRYRSIGNGYNPPYLKEMYYNPNVPLTISNNPRLSVEEGQASLIELQTGNTATPAMCFYSPSKRRSFIVLTDQQSKYGNHGLSIAENAAQDRSCFAITAPAMRKLAPGLGDFHPSGDKAPDWKAGDRLTLRFRIYVMNAGSIPDLLVSFMKHRKDVTGPNQPRNWLPMSYYNRLATTICSNNFRDFPVGSYYLPENNNDFQLGWVSGMINTYPMLALNNEKERTRVVAELDFVVSRLQGESGYFYGGITSAGVLRPEKMHPDFPEQQAMVRKNGDVLLWLIKHLMLFKAQGYEKLIKSDWETAARKLAAAFTRTWEAHGEFGQYITPRNGDIAVFNSTAGAIVPAGLAIASGYFNHPGWVQAAEGSANYYYEKFVVKQGLTGGGCGDISMDADVESAFGFLESLMALYNFTGDKSWLRKAEVQAALGATWVFSYDPVFPRESRIGRLGSHMAGAVWASIQNKHAAPGICTTSGDYLFKLFRATGNPLYADLIRDIQHAHAEAVNVPPDNNTTNNLKGSSVERIQLSDAEGRASIGEYGSSRNSWTETSGMLMAIELPGIYVQTDKKLLRVFDHVEAKIVESNRRTLTLVVKNGTKYDATVSVFAEDRRQALKPMLYTAFTKWPKVRVEAGGEIFVTVNRNGEVKTVERN